MNKQSRDQDLCFAKSQENSIIVLSFILLLFVAVVVVVFNKLPASAIVDGIGFSVNHE